MNPTTRPPASGAPPADPVAGIALLLLVLALVAGVTGSEGIGLADDLRPVTERMVRP